MVSTIAYFLKHRLKDTVTRVYTIRLRARWLANFVRHQKQQKKPSIVHTTPAKVPNDVENTQWKKQKEKKTEPEDFAVLVAARPNVGAKPLFILHSRPCYNCNSEMLALHIFLATGAALWAKACGGPIMHDAASFVREVMENDDQWIPVLDVKIKIDTTLLPHHTVRMLNGLLNGENQSSEPPGGSVIVVSALDVVAQVATKYHKMSGPVELALAAIASGVKCSTLQYLTVQMVTVRKMFAAAQTKDSLRLKEVWTTVVQYMNKLGRMKESLKIESDMHRSWKKVVRDAFQSDLDAAKIDGDLESMSKLMDASFSSTCELHDYKQYESILNLDTTVDESLELPDGPKEVFDKCELLLNEMFKSLPIETMNIILWNDILAMPKDF